MAETCPVVQIPPECLADLEWCGLSHDAKRVHLALLRRWNCPGPDYDKTVGLPIRAIEPELHMTFERFDSALEELSEAGFAWYFEPKRPGRKRRFRVTIPNERSARYASR